MNAFFLYGGIFVFVVTLPGAVYWAVKYRKPDMLVAWLVTLAGTLIAVAA